MTALPAGPLEVDALAESIAELDASKAEMVGAITRQIDFYVTQMGMSVDEASTQARSLRAFPPEEQASAQVSWNALANLIEHESDRGLAVWDRIKADATKELLTGMRASLTTEPRVGGYPWNRARFMAILRSIRKALQPRDELEELLVQQMAISYDRLIVWQGIATYRAEEDAWEGERDRRRALDNMSPRERERYQDDHGWLPPRQSTADAIDQAVTIVDRYQKMFIRLLREFRNMRRLVGTLVVAGGQVNIGEQQVVTTERPPRRSTKPRRGATRTIEGVRNAA